MIWMMNGLTKLSIVITLVFLLSVLSFVWVGFWSYDTKSLKLNVIMDLKMPNHLITAILDLIEKRKFEQLAYDSYEADLHCYECLIVKSPHMYHCKKCDSCIDYHHKHSNFLGKCIGRDNAIAYFWFLFINTVLNTMFVYCLINCINMPQESPNDEEIEEPTGLILPLVNCFITIYERAYILLGSALLLTIHLTLDNFDKLLQICIAIGNLATMREMSDIWMHTHLFKVEKDDYMDPVERVR